MKSNNLSSQTTVAGSPVSFPCPKPFLDLRIHDLSIEPGVTGVCAGYESKVWRHNQLSAHMMEWLPEFALTYEELQSLGSANAVRLLARAAQVIYNTRTASTTARGKRGEIGEILLHIAIRQVFGSVPAVSKFYFKDSANITVKGFDAIHIVQGLAGLELWAGEVKFYKDIAGAMRDAAAEIDTHLGRDYLRSEFALIENKICDSWPYAAELKQLLDRNTSLDKVFSCMVIPVFLSYESKVLSGHQSVTDQFRADIETELRAVHAAFAGKSLPTQVRIHVFLFPMHSKKDLVASFDRRLTACQAIAD